MIKHLSIIISFLFISINSSANILYSWTQVAPNNHLSFRAIIEGDTCPTLNTNLGTLPMHIRAPKTNEFPHIVCETSLSPEIKTATINKKELIPSNEPLQEIAILGDTGCGINSSLGKQICTETDQWPFRKIATSIAKINPNLIIHLGDYHYRAKQCTELKECQDLSGFGWESWKLDFFEPAKDLLNKAPWIMIRGNHEDCKNAWEGWERFFSLEKVSETCDTIETPHLLEYKEQNFLIIDTSSTKDSYKKLAKVKDNITEEFQKTFKQADKLLEGNNLNKHNTWLLTHKPFWSGGYTVHPFYHDEEYSATLAEVNPTSLLERVRIIFSGHTHLFELISFEDTSLPIQVIVGNGGNSLITAKIPKKYSKILQNKKLKYHDIIQEYGYVVLTKDDLSWLLQSFDYNNKLNMEYII